jgi:predicted alpha-1,2-mannosidase
MKFHFVWILIGVSNLMAAQDFQKYVNPMIGTGGTGHTFPGATVPFGMVQLSPDTRIDGSWEGCSGYHYTDAIIYGFSHTHLNGTGVSDYGDILLMPTMGIPDFDPKVYASHFSHQKEKASAGFYSVSLDKHDIDVRLTTSTRVGFHEYTFNKAGQANIILDLNHRDQLLEGEIRIIDQKNLLVKRRSEAWARDQHVYVLITFDKSLEISKIKSNGTQEGHFFNGTELALSFSKTVKKGEKLKVKVALAFTDFEGAMLNSTEIDHWDFEKVLHKAQDLWNKELSKIEITTNDNNKRTIFYTALYHTMMQPNIAQDLDGRYRGMDHNIHRAEGFDYYTVFSLWDTFRATHPLYTLIDQKRTADYINTFLKHYEQGGRLPVWELASNETDCMIGYHSVSVIADAMVKGIKGFDYEKAFEASKHSAMLHHLGLDAYKKQGFISIDDEHESVSKTLEYAYDDWCIAQMANLLDKPEDYAYFMERSQYWKNLFHVENGFIQPKKNGGWDIPFDPKEVNNNYTEANGWQYTFFVPQDIPGMIDAYGGAYKFEAKLDEMFNSESETSGRHQVDITGLIGQYAHGNEPSHHVAYLYNFIGKPEKATEKVHFILNNFYKNDPDGLIGNEDCGQMSAWYVLSSLGLYNVTPGQPYWTTVTPYFEKAVITFEDGSKRTILPKTTKDILEKIGFEDVKPLPELFFSEILTVPFINAVSKTFDEILQISFGHSQEEVELYYKLLDTETQESKNYKLYEGPIILQKSATVSVKAMDRQGNSSPEVSASFFKKPNTYTIQLHASYNPQYHAGGPEGLIDGVYGTTNWRKGEWQGYQSQDFEAIIDMQTTREISAITANFLQDTRSWILMPTEVLFYVSDDGLSFKMLESIKNDVDPKNYESIIKGFKSSAAPQKGRYVKVIAKNFGKLPEWHQGFPFDADAFIFIDEIIID